MARVLVMIPSGEVYDHDNVRWYDYKDVQQHINHYHNIGDAFVFDSSLKLLNFDKLECSRRSSIRSSTTSIASTRNTTTSSCAAPTTSTRTCDWSQTAEVLQAAQDPGHRLRHRRPGPGEGQDRAFGGDARPSCA